MDIENVKDEVTALVLGDSEVTPTDIRKEGAEYVYNFAKKVIDTTGPRLPGTEEEALGAQVVAEEMEKATGSKAFIEKFKLAPKASIACIPCCGWAGFIAAILYYVSPIASLIVSAGAFLYAILQIFTYSGALDKLWIQHESQNVWSEVLPEDGKYDYTIMFSGHIDSSWLCKLFLKSPKTAVAKIALGVVGILVVIVVSAVRVGLGELFFWAAEVDAGSITCAALNAVTLITSAMLAQYITWNKKVASPGAMDNLTGVGFSVYMAKYFKEHPEEMPKNCRIVCAGLGSEEAGLKGSFAYVKAHKDEEKFKNTYVINIDSVRDFDHFNVVKGDLWLFSHFDKELIEAAKDSMRDAGHKPGVIVNPVGGCDSTPFYRAGLKTVTMIAQNPNVTDYYHTYKDTVEGLNKDTLADFTTALISMTKRVAEIEEKKRAE